MILFILNRTLQRWSTIKMPKLIEVFKLNKKDGTLKKLFGFSKLKDDADTNEEDSFQTDFTTNAFSVECNKMHIGLVDENMHELRDCKNKLENESKWTTHKKSCSLCFSVKDCSRTYEKRRNGVQIDHSIHFRRLFRTYITMKNCEEIF